MWKHRYVPARSNNPSALLVPCHITDAGEYPVFLRTDWRDLFVRQPNSGAPIYSDSQPMIAVEPLASSIAINGVTKVTVDRLRVLFAPNNGGKKDQYIIRILPITYQAGQEDDALRQRMFDSAAQVVRQRMATLTQRMATLCAAKCA